MSRIRIAAVALAAAAAACASPVEQGSDASTAGFRFIDVSEDAGLTRVVHAGRPDKDHLLDSAGTGAAWLDFDGDGWMDLYVVNGWLVDGERIVEKGRNALYRNRGDGSFEDVTEKAGVDGEGQWGSGVAVADYDGDGRQDILVTNFGPNLLYRNQGDGTFENVAGRAGIEIPGWNTGAAFFDADGDGDLDLYVATYIECTIEEVLAARPSLDWKGVDQVAFGPFGLEGAQDYFFYNDGAGGFVEATDEAGLRDLGRGFGFGVRAADFDLDGDQDLYVANDSDANYFYRNEGGGRFKETGLWSGSAFDSKGAAQAGMGVAAGDFDGDLILDLFVTNFSEDFSTLYLAQGDGFFEDVSEISGVGEPTYPALSWGTVFADLDNDRDVDLVVANGHIYPQVDRHPEFGFRYEQSNLLLENLGAARFENAAGRSGPGFDVERSSRGLAAADYDNDGDLDLLFTNLDAGPSLLRNDSAVGNWLAVALEVSPGDGTEIGARVVVTVNGVARVRDRSSGGSFLSVHDPRLHFGLGAATEVERLEVFWPDGSRQVLENLAANRFVTVRKP